MSTCTDLINAINAVVIDPNLLASIDPSTIAVLSNIGTTETVFQLGSGGAAVISIPASPSVDGVPFKIIVGGKFHTAVSSGTGLGAYLGNSTTLGSNQALFTPGSNGLNGNGNFMWSSSFLWDSTSQTLNFMDAVVSGLTSGNSVNTINSISSQNSLQFVLSTKFGTGNSANSATITTFKIELL